MECSHDNYYTANKERKTPLLATLKDERQHPHQVWGKSIPMYLAKYSLPSIALLFFLIYSSLLERNKKINNVKIKINVLASNKV
jgi:hypothetical protein